MEPVYWETGGLKYVKNPERMYCKVKTCKYRAVNPETELCGFHQKYSENDIVSELKPFKLNDQILYSFPQKEEYYKLRPKWLMPMKH